MAAWPSYFGSVAGQLRIKIALATIPGLLSMNMFRLSASIQAHIAKTVYGGSRIATSDYATGRIAAGGYRLMAAWPSQFGNAPMLIVDNIVAFVYIYL
jgi:hypothetical protein